MTDQIITITDAVDGFITAQSALDATEQAELRRFERWLGKTKAVAGLKPLDIEHYACKLSPSDPECGRKLDAVRKFLVYARDKDWTTTNLGLHLKAKRGKTQAKGVTRAVRPELAMLTKQGYTDIVKELEGLKSQRPKVLEDIRRAAADKDFRENAPLHAAREQLGHIDGRIQELTAIVKSANIIGGAGAGSGKVSPGDTVRMAEISSGQIAEYTIVGPKEVDPAQGKISHISPIGKAVIDKAQGDTVEVVTPSGSRCYRIEGIKKG